MRRRWLPSALIFVVLAPAAAATLHAQTRRPPPRRAPRPAPPPAQRGIGIRGYVISGTTALAAEKTFEAVAGTRRRSSFGGGVQVTDIWKGVFADVSASRLSLSGQRVFVDGGRVFKLGIPLEVTMRPFDVAGGWRLRLLRGRILPYAGAGMTLLRYEERSDFAGSGEDVSETKAGPLVLAGVDARIWRFVSAGGDLRWRRVRKILGEGGVSDLFDEDDVGGVGASLRISIGR